MNVITVPVSDKQKKVITDMVKSGRAANKAHAVRMAIDLLEREEAIMSVLRAEADVRAGRVFKGDLASLSYVSKREQAEINKKHGKPSHDAVRTIKVRL